MPELDDGANLTPREFLSSLSAEEKQRLDKRLGFVNLPNNWQPRPYQLEAWNFLLKGGMRACLIWHRRSGKDSLSLNFTAVSALTRVGDYWHMFPEQAHARRSMWDATNPHTGVRLIDQAFPSEIRKSTRDQDMMIRFINGSTWRLVGSDNYNSLVGSTPAGIVFSEWAMADPKADAFLRPILAESKGWAIYITTPRGSNHAKSTYEAAKENSPRWFSQILTVDDTDVFTAETLAEELRANQKLYGPDDGKAFFEQEYYCSWTGAFAGSIFGSHLSKAQKDGRIGNVSIERTIPVHTAWDLGISDSTAIWFIQKVGREFCFVDYHEGSGVGLDEYARVLADKKDQHRWNYGTHYFPHDVAHRELGNKGRSRIDTLRQLRIEPVRVVPASNVNDGINGVRQILDQAWIDEKRCERGLNALRSYRREWNDKLRTFRDAPLHDWASHAADALRTFACGHRDIMEKVTPSTGRIPIIEAGRGPMDRGTGWMGR